jgi:hypothetical protein
VYGDGGGIARARRALARRYAGDVRRSRAAGLRPLAIVGPVLMVGALFAAACTKTDETDVETSRTSVSFDAEAGRVVPAATLVDAGTSTCAEVATGRVTSELVLDDPGAGGGGTLTADGAFDTTNGRSAATVDVGGFVEQLTPDFAESELGSRFADALGGTIKIVGDGTAIYVDAEFLRTLFGADQQWVRFDADSGYRGLGEWLPYQSRDACDVTAVLDRVGNDVVELGREDIDGAETTHYRTTVDQASAVDALELPLSPGVSDVIPEPAVVDAWVDDDGIVRRVEIQQGAEPGAAVALTFALSEINEPVSIDVPPPDQVGVLDPDAGLFGLGGS